MVCPFCGSNPPPRGQDFSQVKCPLAPYLPRLEKRWARGYQPKKEDLADETEVKEEHQEPNGVIDTEASVETKREMEQQKMNVFSKIKKAQSGLSSPSAVRPKTSSDSDSPLQKSKPVIE